MVCTSVHFDPAPPAAGRRGCGRSSNGDHRHPLAQPLVVRVNDATGAPVAGAQVVFRVVQGNGTLEGGVRGALVSTDVEGRAEIFFTLGTRAGVGVNRVRATAVGFAGEVVFSAIASTAAPTAINVVSGDNQKGGVARALARPLVVLVTDAGQNPVAGVPVSFEVVAGDGAVDGGVSTVVLSDEDGRAAVALTLGPEAGLDNNLVEARFPGLATLPATFKASALVLGDPAETRLSGVVLDNQGAPVPGTTLRIRGTSLVTTSDAEGQFQLSGVPVGHVLLEVDASTTSRPGVWAGLEFDLDMLPGVGNTLPKPIYVLPLDLEHGRIAGGAEDVTITVPGVPGFALTVLAGSVTFPDGSPTGLVSVTPVHADKVPMPPGSGMQPRFIVTIQPAGAHFDPPAPISFPNVDGLPPGTVTEMFSFDHDLGEFVSIGTGTVSGDGLVVRSDPGFGIVKAGWHCSAPQSESGAGSALYVRITSGPPVILVQGAASFEEKMIEAEGGPPLDSIYSWEIDDVEIATLDPSGSGLCANSTRCDTLAMIGNETGVTNATVTIECTTTGHRASDSTIVVTTAIKLEEVTFSGSGFHEVSEDGGESYVGPHWRDSSSPLDGDADDPGDHRFPVSYTRNNPLELAVTFAFEPTVNLEIPVKLRGFGSAGLVIPETLASAENGKIRASGLTTMGVLPDEIRRFDPLEITWQISLDDGASWLEAGKSENRLFVTLADPITSPLYETLLDVGTRNADGQTTAEAAVAAIWADFAGPIPGVRRKLLDGHNRADGTEMRYWVEEGSEIYPEVYAFCQTFQAMINPTPDDPRLNGIGTCNAWARVFHETIRAQGISDSRVVEVTSIYPDTEFLVKNWIFSPPGSAPAACNPFAYLQNEVTDLPGTPGQGTANPPGSFFNHYIILFNHKYYDPSYGAGPFLGSTDLEAKNSWENASVAGYMFICPPGTRVIKPNDPSVLEVVFALE
ncbi:MAG: hypothetical protein HC897_02785 [Thermoanaerobaculia bacterium]|nr:hypothetical protein [Thermoanaerobaculia bacterium]